MDKCCKMCYIEFKLENDGGKGWINCEKVALLI